MSALMDINMAMQLLQPNVSSDHERGLETQQAAVKIHLAIMNDRPEELADLLRSHAGHDAVNTVLGPGLPSSPLGRATALGNLVCVTQLLAGGASTETPDVKGRTPLLVATASAQEAVALELLAHGARTDGSPANNSRPLLLAAQAGHLDLARALLAAGASPDVQPKRPDWPLGLREQPSRGPLHLAVAYDNWPVFKVLLQAGADPDYNCSGFAPEARSSRSKPLLGACTSRGRTECYGRLLLAAGASPYWSDSSVCGDLGDGGTARVVLEARRECTSSFEPNNNLS
uniref:Uncharacterized protein n=1 Tax=Eptatretus burgeri TaxID=7764 RepID=A0A8C4R6E3_EPTBU